MIYRKGFVTIVKEKDKKDPGMKDFKKYKDAYEKRRTEEEKKLKAEARRAGRAADKVARMFGGVCGVKKVVLFGSVIDGRFGEASDIDLGVEGLEKEKYNVIEALVEAESVAGFQVDIKLLEDARESFRERIKKTGKVLYER